MDYNKTTHNNFDVNYVLNELGKLTGISNKDVYYEELIRVLGESCCLISRYRKKIQETRIELKALANNLLE